MCKSIFVRIVVYFMVLKEKRNHGLLVCNLSPIFEKVKLDVRRSLEPFKSFKWPLWSFFNSFDQTLSNVLQQYLYFSHFKC